MNISQAIVAYAGFLTALFDSVSSQVVPSGTKCNYTNHDVNLIICIYEREECREELLIDWMVERPIAANDKGTKETCCTCKSALE